MVGVFFCYFFIKKFGSLKKSVFYNSQRLPHFVKWTLQFDVFCNFVGKLFGYLNYFLYLCIRFNK